MNGMKEKGRYQFNWSESLISYLYTTIDETGKRKGSIICRIQIYFYFRGLLFFSFLSEEFLVKAWLTDTQLAGAATQLGRSG